MFALLTTQTPETPEPTDGSDTIPPSAPAVEDAIPTDVQEGAVENINALGPFFGVLLNVSIGVLVGIIITVALFGVMWFIFRTRARLRSHLRPLFLPTLASLGFLGARVGAGLSGSDTPYIGLITFILLVAVATSFAWLALRFVKFVSRRVMLRFDADTVDDRRQRKVKTQMALIYRVLTVVIIVVAIAAVLLAIPQVRALGAGLLASAGVVSVIAGLAVQSTLTNVFAGIQLAFTDAIRVGDVVQVEEYYGTIEDITLSYVVVKIWDNRRVIYPSSYFTTTPFENYTRVGTEISGTVELEVDWDADMTALRQRLRALVESTELWDGRDAKIQVLDMMNSNVLIRAVVSAANAGDLWDLRCLVREDLVAYLRVEQPHALPKMRMDSPFAGSVLGGAEDTEELTETGEQSQPRTKKPQAEQVSSEKTKNSATDSTRTDPMTKVTPVTTDRLQRWYNEKEPPVALSALPKITDGKPVPVSSQSGNKPVDGHDQKTGVGSSVEPTETGTAETGTTGTPEARVGSSAEQASEPGTYTGSLPLTVQSEDSSMYTGSIENLQRGRDLAGPGEDAYEERAAQQNAAQEDK